MLSLTMDDTGAAMRLDFFKITRLILSGALLGIVITHVAGGTHAQGLPEIIGAFVGAGSAAVLMKYSLLG